MPLITYTERKFSAANMQVVETANTILDEYADAGFDLTLRQLYYQFVARGLMKNDQKNYKRLGGIISDARRAGLIDWGRIVDRTRYVRKPAAWDSAAEIVEACAKQFAVDWWAGQSCRPEVWVEKDALVGVVEVACDPWHLPFLSCRGYMSDSELWSSARRFRDWKKTEKQDPIVFHLGDHDPSGVDMTRDIEDRLTLFAGIPVKVIRLALTMEQVEQYQPPPNPAKTTDARYQGYADEHGEESWELDALEPTVIAELIETAVKPLLNKKLWKLAEKRQDDGRETLEEIAERWDDIREFLGRD